MTRNDLVDAVFDKQRSLANCLTDCSGIDCEQCSENLVKKYEEEIKADERKKFAEWLWSNYDIFKTYNSVRPTVDELLKRYEQ